MTPHAKSLLDQILALSIEEQQYVANGLLDRLEGDVEMDALDDPDYRAELDRRIEEVGNGTADCVPLDEAIARIQARLSKIHSSPTIGSV